ncbi:aldehyde dehydrogenase family protein [Janibacter limosus]|uniref:aldehyde dehydrogenase family protein n=1 Tax=Janibacter limosus TaxID=53458 RepID=UPI0035DABB50|nr:aldehyde dehydrogenase family protein [Janibacter limosus]
MPPSPTTKGASRASASSASTSTVHDSRSCAPRWSGRSSHSAWATPARRPPEVGPLINEDAAQRVEGWVQEAVDAGAKVLTGGRRDGTTYAPTVLDDVPMDAKVSREEVFGPVLLLHAVDSVDEAFTRVNDSRYGRQAGVFTHDLRTAFRAQRELEVGA